MTHIALPNGTVINAKTICTVRVNPAYKSKSGTEYDLKPSVIVIYLPTPSREVVEQIMCETDDEAIDIRDRIIARLNEHTPIIPV